MEEVKPIEIRNRTHRKLVGGMWEELGKLQLDFLIRYGLKPEHKLLDIGCGCLRGGIPIMKYLNEGNYFGIDKSSSLINAGREEISEAKLEDKNPVLMIDNNFSLYRFSERFDYMISVSLFTHLTVNNIVKCLSEVKKRLKTGGQYFSSFFLSPCPAYTQPIKQHSGIKSHYNRDPFHYSIEEMKTFANYAGLKCLYLGKWNHPRNQHMLVFKHK